tara:strand:- start:249 stop:491 length:243 start_codon:yes stop_codon:yes gene_type:complete
MPTNIERLFGINCSKRHGDAYDRGSADCYYGRPSKPHYIIFGDAHKTLRIEKYAMSCSEIEAYDKGYEDQEKSGDKKEWE